MLQTLLLGPHTAVARFSQLSGRNESLEQGEDGLSTQPYHEKLEQSRGHPYKPSPLQA